MSGHQDIRPRVLRFRVGDSSSPEAPAAEPRGFVASRVGAYGMATILMLYFSLTAYSLSLIPVVAAQLHGPLLLSDSQVGLLTSVLMFMLGIVAIPAGLAAGRWGGRVMLVACAIYVAGSIVFAFSDSFAVLLLARAVQGIGVGVTVPACTVVLAQALPPERRGRAWGVFGAGHGLGVVVALLVLPHLAEMAGYRGVFLATAGLAALLGVLLALLSPVRALPAHPEGLPSPRVLMKSLRETASNHRVLFLALFNVTTLGVGVGALAWTPQYLSTTFASTACTAANLTAAIGAAQLVGNPIGALAMGRFGRLPVIGTSLVLMALSIVMVPFVNDLRLVCVLVTLAGFFSMTYFPALYSYIALVVQRPEQVGVASGIVNVFGFGGALLTPYLFGLILDHAGVAAGYLGGYLLLTGFAAVGLVGVALFHQSSSSGAIARR